MVKLRGHPQWSVGCSVLYADERQEHFELKMSAAPPLQPDATHSPSFWRWGLLIVLLITALIRWYRLEVPMERDEGEYAYAGQLILQGIPPYVLAYNMKLPGIYAVYAGIEWVFGDTLQAIHLGLLVVNLASILVVYQIGRLLLDERGAFFSSAVFALLSSHWSVTGLFANSEHFVVLPVLLGTWCLIRASDQGGWWRWALAGLCMGTGFIVKQHGILFAAFGGVVLVLNEARVRPIPLARILCDACTYLLGAVIPFAVICLWMSGSGVFDRFWFWTFTYSPHYVAQIPLTKGLILLRYQISHMTGGELAPIWLLSLLGIVATVVDPEIRRWRNLLGLWVGFSLLSVCPGLYFRGHYFLFTLPVFSVLAGAAITMFAKSRERTGSGIPISALAGGLILFAVIQQRQFLLTMPDADVTRNIFGENAFAESPAIGEYLEKHSSPEDTIAVIGSEPQIYFHARRRSATGYIYMYPLQEKHPFCEDMQKEMIQQIETSQPRYMLYVNVKDSWLRVQEPYTNLRDWYPDYLKRHYELVGLVQLHEDSESTFRWDDDVKEAVLPDPEEAWVSVYRRRAKPSDQASSTKTEGDQADSGPRN